MTGTFNSRTDYSIISLMHDHAFINIFRNKTNLYKYKFLCKAIDYGNAKVMPLQKILTLSVAFLNKICSVTVIGV